MDRVLSAPHHALFFLPVFTNVIFLHELYLAHIFYTSFTHGPNTSTSAQYDNTQGASITKEGCTFSEKKEGLLHMSKSSKQMADGGFNKIL